MSDVDKRKKHELVLRMAKMASGKKGVEV